jgi:hypothetical protein
VNARDQRILSELRPELREAVEEILTHVNAPGKLPAGMELRPHQGYRPPEEQLKAYKAGRSKLKFGKHNYRPARACDLVWCVDGKWSWDVELPWWLVGYWAEQAGLSWGGRWGTPQAERKRPCRDGMPLGWDCPHVELRT